MSEIERVKKVVDWLIFEKIVDSRRDLAEKLGYTESSLSQILNEKVNLSDKFIKKLSKVDNRINKEWIVSGVDSMILNQIIENNVVAEPQAEYRRSKQVDIPYELYKLTLENEKLTKEKELELIKQNRELIEMLKKAYEK